jgi:alpha-1,6-mannosyltransferase
MARQETGRWQLPALGASLIALTGAGLALYVPGTDTISQPRLWVFEAILAVACVIWAASIRVILTGSGKRLLTVLLVAAAMRAIVLPAPPFLSSDIYRYVWDGRVQNAGINPYRYIPADPALAPMRDDAIYPHVNRREYARTIYLPAAQLVFRAVAAISPTVLAMKIAMVLVECVAIGAMIALLRCAGLPPARVAIYAWNPLTVWSFALDGHVDALAIGLLALAMLARGLRRDSATGVAIAAATLTKIIPLVAFPALWRRWEQGRGEQGRGEQGRGDRSWDWRMPAAFVATAVLLYAPFIDLGWHVLGFLPGYAQEEGIDQGTGFWLLDGIGQLTKLPHAAVIAYVVIVAVVLGAIGLRFAFAPPLHDPHADIIRMGRHVAVLGAAFMALLSPHYEWYYPWLALPACIATMSSVLWLTAAPMILYLNPWEERFWWPSLIFVPFAALAVRDVLRTQRKP